MLFAILLFSDYIFLSDKNKSIQNIIHLSIAFKYRPISQFSYLFIGIVLLCSCNSTKYVPENKYLLNSVKVKLDGNSIKNDEIKGYIKQKPNKRILGIRFHLGLYNLSNLKKEKGINKYLRKIGEEPSIWEPYVTKRTVEQLKIYLKRKGYYYNEVKDSIKIKKKKLNLIYFIKPGNPYKIRNITFNAEDSNIRKILFADTINTLIKRKGILDEDILTNERMRLEYLFKNNGYYNFSKDFIYFNIDTAFQLRTDIAMQINNNEIKSGKGNVILPYKVFKIRNVTISTESNQGGDRDKYGNIIKTDSIFSNGLKFIYRENFYVKPSVILQSNYLIPGNTFHISNVDETRRYLYSLNVFSMVDIQFKEIPPSDSTSLNYLDCKIRLLPLTIQSNTVEVEGTNSSGNLGGALNLVYQHRSLFGNAEALNLKFRGAMEAIKSNNVNHINKTVEYGVEATINFPKFLLPLNTINFVKKYNPKTSVTIAYNYQKRPDFTRTVANTSFGYNWKQNRFITHYFNPVEINYVDIKNKTAGFDSLLKDPYLKNSYTNHLVTVTSYSLVYNSQNINKSSSFSYFRFNVESAGSIVTLVNKISNNPKFSEADGNSYYKLFATRYSQYVRTDVDFRHYRNLSPGSSVAYRFFAGLAYPYGNSNAVPFEKQYFSGGANSIRGWQVRTVGPGSFKDSVTTTQYPNSTGDIKLEANIEYRFKIIWILRGALFADAGNIWTIKYSKDRKGSQFLWDKFVNDIAVGSGFGFRFDLKFFLFRTDIGLKMRDPSRDIGDRWIFSQKRLMASDFAISIAIGYPF
jgi:outer membrane protein assembly factor BamA